jgi:RNA polymerase sigma-70 factor (TIGR02943 family)
MSVQRSFSPDNWVDNYADELFRYTLARVGDHGFAEDIVQETLLSGWRARETYKGDASEKNWLYAICKNKIIDHFRKQASNIVTPNIDEAGFYFNEEEHWKDDKEPLNWQVEYQYPIETIEFYSVLKQCMNKLKGLQQQIFVMKYMEEMETENICKVLNITTSNYWVLMHRCKLHLRSCLEKHWFKNN